jgi:hypothetical protein
MIIGILYLLIGLVYCSIHFQATPKEFFEMDNSDKMSLIFVVMFWPMVIVMYFLDRPR